MKPESLARLPSFLRPGPYLLSIVLLAPHAINALGGDAEILPSDSKVLHPWEGGVDPRPFITAIHKGDLEGTLLLKWSGIGGPYTIEQRSSVTGGVWTAVGGPTTELTGSVIYEDSIGFLRIHGAPTADYIGASVCRGCHPTTHDGWAETVHKGAFDTLKAIGQSENAFCIPCHTVGYGLPGGFISESATPRLVGVQCENCHGPGGNHSSDPGNLDLRPVVSQAGMTCGGCHNGFHHPTYDEWLTAAHSEVTEDVAAGFANPDRAAAEARMRSCGSCHSGAVRLAMVNGAAHGDQQPAMPSADHAMHTAITCAVCHTAHEKTEFGSQLRNPPYSTNFFSYSTSTNTNFALQYNEQLNVCGQCHNMRGARWQDTSRPPHHSPQYNVLIGDVGFDIGTSQQSSHRNIAKQCSHCHTHQHGTDNPSEEEPVYTGHAFEPLPENCAPCHTVSEATAFISFRQRNTRLAIGEVKGLLDSWSTNKAPEPLKSVYGTLAWEYNNAGELSMAPDGSAQMGPTSTEQTIIPDEIKQARFFLYIVQNDGSVGVHNAMFTTHLLEQARNLVQAKLNE